MSLWCDDHVLCDGESWPVSDPVSCDWHLAGKWSVANWHSHSEHGHTGDTGGRGDQGVGDPGDQEVPGGDKQGGGGEWQVLSVEDAEGVSKDPSVPKIDKCYFHRKFVEQSQ